MTDTIYLNTETAIIYSHFMKCMSSFDNNLNNHNLY